MDNNSLAHTKWDCKYHLGATCGRCLKCASALSLPFVIFLPRNCLVSNERCEAVGQCRQVEVTSTHLLGIEAHG